MRDNINPKHFILFILLTFGILFAGSAIMPKSSVHTLLFNGCKYEVRTDSTTGNTHMKHCKDCENPNHTIIE